MFMIQAEHKARKFDLEDRLVNYSIQVIEIVEMLPNTRAGNHLAGQLIRSGTAPALNYGEAQGAESRSDFIHKMKISLKELRETLICLKIIHRKPLITPQDRLAPVMQETNELISIFMKSITTAQTRK
jgi:four helix bundle protein